MSDRIGSGIFASVDMRVGTVIAARHLENARNPAIVLEIDFGPLGVLKSSAQVTALYTPAALLGRQVIAVVNLPPRQVGSVMSRCLVLGAVTPGEVVLLSVDAPVANGTRVR